MPAAPNGINVCWNQFLPNGSFLFAFCSQDALETEQIPWIAGYRMVRIVAECASESLRQFAVFDTFVY